MCGAVCGKDGTLQSHWKNMFERFAISLRLAEVFAKGGSNGFVAFSLRRLPNASKTTSGMERTIDMVEREMWRAHERGEHTQTHEKQGPDPQGPGNTTWSRRN